MGFGTGILVAIWIVAQGYSSYHIYFDKWLPDPATYEAYLGEWKAMIEEVNPKSVDSGEVYLVPTGSQFPRGYHPYQFDYLYTGSLPVHLFKMGESDAAEEVYQALVQDQLQQSVRRVNVVNWTRGEHWGGDGTDRLLFLLNKYAQPESPARYTNYDVYPFQRIELGKPWQLYDQLEPLNVEYDGHISLLGVAFGLHGGEQKLREQPVRLPSELRQQPLWLVLMWRADQRMTSDYRVSLRLHDATGALVFQQDQDLRNYDRLTTRGWGAQAIVESLHTMAVPPDLPKGAYQLRVVLYDNVTLTPTVQIGVWQPEYRLAEFVIE